MNPPAALYGAMNRERKPFTYTPGGLDLSEIKSERMAKRLMRNAMNQGVPETPAQSVVAPPTSSIPVAIPNFNCLPVQVFPTFQLPANPKTLLRTRSNPDGSSDPSYKSSFLSNDNNKSNLSSRSSLNTNKPCMIPTVKSYNNKTSHSNNIKEETNDNCNLEKLNGAPSSSPISKLHIPFEENNLLNTIKEAHIQNIVKEDIYYKTPSITNEFDNKQNLNLTIPENNKTATLSDFGTNSNKLLQTSYDNSTDDFILPEISYEAEYLTTLPEESVNLNILTVNNNQNGAFPSKRELELNLNLLSDADVIKKEEINNNNKNISNECDNINKNVPLSPEIYYEAENIIPVKELVPENKNFERINVDVNRLKNITDCEQNSITRIVDNKPDLFSNSFKDDSDKKKEVKTVKKQSEKEVEKSEAENHNGDTEAAVVVKLPSKKSEAKTETQVEVVTKGLPDGSVEEVTKTITKTTIDGRTEIKTRTETKTIPKEEPVEEEYEEEEESEEIENEESENLIDTTEVKSDGNNDTESHVEKENISNDSQVKNGIITQEEKSETSLKKKVVIIQSELPDSEEEEEVIEEIEEEDNDVEPDVEEVIVLKSKSKDDAIDVEEITSQISNVEDSKNTNIESEILVSDEDENEIEEKKEVARQENENEKIQSDDLEVEKEVNADESEEDVENDLEEEEEIEIREENDTEIENKQSQIETQQVESETEEKEEVEEEFEEAEDTEDKEVGEEKIQLSTDQSDITNDQTDETDVKVTKEECNETVIPIQLESKENDLINDQCAKESLSDVENKKEESSETILPIQHESKEKVQEKNETEDESKSILLQIKSKESLREASVPLEKVEEVEIKPIGPTQEIIKKSHTEIITTKTDSPSGALSTQTEYNVIENFVTVNRMTKTLDHAYEQAAEHTLPIIRSYIPPNNTSSQPTFRPYQSSVTEPDTEKRHSLLFDRISVERQIPPAEIYQNNYSYNNNDTHGYEETQYLFQPQSEVLEESNVKPSTISKNQQWYQQTKKDNFFSNNNEPSGTSYDWNQPQQQPQQQPQPKPQAQLPQQSYQPQFVSHPQPHPQFQSSYVENTSKDTYKTLTDNYKQNFNSYTSKPSWVSSTLDTKPTLPQQFDQYSSLNNQSTETYQQSTQQFNSSYVPPPWEQNTGYVIDNINQNIYQPPSSVSKPSPKSSQPGWEPNPTASKFSKSTPTSYIPPAPNQSFVKPVNTMDPPKLPGRKTYYSEYERRYISVPESTYIPTETKYQAQPNPSPVYYYDNNEAAEMVEPQWRKELREFTEKTQTSTQISETSVRPPWEEEPKYGGHNLTHSTPTWSQTLRPQSWRERSYEPEYTGVKELPKTNTLGRGRPQSSYLKNNMDRIPERPRGVSVDRYNPNSYQSPVGAEHPPVQSQTLDPSIHPKPHYNPNVPGYHSRASAEPREHPTYSQPRLWVESRTPPIQSRSFKYLQWITGTED